MNTLVVLFNLRAGVDPAVYEKWAQTTDLPVVNSLGSVGRFDVYRSSGLFGSGNPAPYSYVEIIDVIDMDQFGNELGSELMRKVAAEFQSFADNPVFILTSKLS